MSAGVELFARYALAPNALGFCGPPTGLGSTEREVRAAATRFSGAWPYLRVLARLTGTADPLDARLVEAYWLGRDTGVDGARFGTDLLEIIGPQAGHYWGHLTPDLLSGASGDHGFHVFAVYPWSRLLDTGLDHPRHVLDSCRIRWGTVLTRTADGVEVESRRLDWDGAALTLGSPAPERIEADHVLVGVEVGDTVALHWEWLCDRLTVEQATDLERTTRHHLAATTARLRSGEAR
ncbi:DUF6390 family protein [Pseudonocardia abyssalis]|uniref:Uncharacterized protein n=1 Tax=Pseudonocardia abyssalis TaxID=2792008 RepID=A0ABS6UUY4_9PSEU|nr:DUF6390 family protein [Pseudonocardia abyssalis]MBW0118276.1 hypothetical protein [Pseudonocardia abyssalis]MBW0136073.1 hypothetical protein [Pseudonocardia abyssalis]